jgi:ATP-binding cassette, subfamily B, bacterial RamA/AmfB
VTPTKDEATATPRYAYRAADRLLLQASRHGSAWVVVVALAAIMTSAVSLAFPTVLGHAVDGIVGGGTAGAWLTWTAVLVALLVGGSALDVLASGAAVARSTAWLRRTMLHHALALGTRPAEALGPGEMATRLVANASEAARVAPALAGAGTSLIMGVGGIVALALIDPLLCAAFVIGMPALALIVRAFARDASALATSYLTVQGRIAERLTGAISGARTIAAAGTLEREVDRSLSALPQLRRHGMDLWRVSMRITAQDALLVAMLEIAVIGTAGVLLARGQISAGEMLAAAQYGLLATSLNSLTGVIARITAARAAAQRLVEILDQAPVHYGGRRLPAGRGRLELRGVSVQSDGELALERIDLVVPAGALVAVVGASGAGKSLLAALVGRLVDPSEGEILLDGVPLREIDRDELRRAVGYGFARPALLGETIGAAIAFGHDAPPDEELKAAASAARADDFIRLLPDGYATPLSQTPMSGGEVQRVGLARTFAHAGRVLVLDDVAASLDTVTEHHISRVLTGALADRTRLIVAHRASTVSRMDAVIWLERGRVRAMAPHRELWQNPDYRALFEADETPVPAPARQTLVSLGAGP